jgi:phospholipid-binding lipoprotein MlaA
MNKRGRGLAIGLAGAALACALAGCAQPPKTVHGVSDPLEPVNRAVFDLNMLVNDLIVRPVSEVYRGVTPDPAEEGVANFFRNVGYLHVVANDVLQLELDDAWQGTQRLAINTTVGVGGIFDPATEMGLPYRQENFGATAAKWGLPSGPYLVLPLLGPSTLRSVPDVPMRLVTNPIFYLDAGLTQTALSGTGALSKAAEEAESLDEVEAAVSPYAFVREAWLARQMRIIREGEAEAPFEPLPPELLGPEAAEAVEAGDEAPASEGTISGPEEPSAASPETSSSADEP